MITLTNVTKEYDGLTVLDNVSFSVEPGEFVCLTGPSGAGKSTIINLLIRAELPTSGALEVDGADLSKLPMPILQIYRRKTGVVFQDYKLLPDRTVSENISFALEVCGEPDAVIAERLPEILRSLKLEARADAYPHQLSGGEMTRVALARALVHKPSILIADEPTGNIDPQQSGEILSILRTVNASGTTVILATHDKLVVDALAVRVIRLEQGKLVRDSVGSYEAAKIVEKKHEAPKQAAEVKAEGEEAPATIKPVSENGVAIHHLKSHGAHEHKKAAHHEKHEKKEEGEDHGHHKGHIKPIEG